MCGASINVYFSPFSYLPICIILWYYSGIIQYPDICGALKLFFATLHLSLISWLLHTWLALKALVISLASIEPLRRLLCCYPKRKFGRTIRNSAQTQHRYAFVISLQCDTLFHPHHLPSVLPLPFLLPL
jgi:hypothetical protein